MIKCESCGTDVSETAASCPSCGHQLKKSVGFLFGFGIFVVPYIAAWFTLRKGYSTKARVIALGWMVFALLISSGMMNQDGYETRSASKQSSSSQSSSSSAPKPLVISADALVKAYADNEIAADDAYKDQLVQVTGIIDDIGKDIMDDAYVTMAQQEWGLGGVQAYFHHSAEGVGKLKKNTRTTVTCKVDGLMMNVVLKDCFI